MGGRRAPRGAVRESILRLLAEGPLNGYQIMTAIAERTADRWRPSPGAIYPALSQLEDEGLIVATVENDQKVYVLTAPGREAAQAVPETPWVDPHRDPVRGPATDAARMLMETVRMATQTGTPDQLTSIAAELDATRRTILRLLADAS